MEWDKSSDSPLAYTSEDRYWGLVKTAGRWLLYRLSSGNPVKRIREFHSDDPPFEDAEKAVAHFDSLRGTATWEEATIGKRKPGEEGPTGATPIPMQTQGPKRKGHRVRPPRPVRRRTQ